jgi:DNA-binding GntR family transcriptional regulator
MKRITSKELKALENNLDTAEHEVMQGDPKVFVHRDAEFHEILARASGRERLFELCDLLRKHMLRYRVQGLYLPESALRAIEGHRRIFESLRAGDEKGLELAIRDHLEWVMTDVHQNAFRKYGDDSTVSGNKNA